MPLPTLYWLADNVGGPGVQVGYNWKPILSRLQHYPMIFELPGGTTNVLTCTPRLVPDKVAWRNLLEGLLSHRSGLLGPLLGR
jgi:hypothetical protein